MTKLPPLTEPCHEKTCHQSFGQGLTQTGLYSQRRRLEALGSRGMVSIFVTKTKVLISCVVTVQLICAFFVYAKSRFSHDMADLFYKVIVFKTNFKSCMSHLQFHLWQAGISSLHVELSQDFCTSHFDVAGARKHFTVIGTNLF